MLPRRTDLPHVTDMLSRVGLTDFQWAREYDLVRGSAMHAATQYLDEGDLDWRSVDPVLLGRLRSYQRFKDELDPTILAVEEEVVNETFRYCGRIDRRLIIRGREGILDIKGPARAPWQALQVCLYARCYPRPMARWTLHLSDDRYNLFEHAGRSDWNASLAVCTLAAWRDSVERT